jgi:mycothiol synthase
VGFRPGTDDAAWLSLNALAFAQHPEQGRMTQRDLDDRKAEPWFDPEDFLLLWDGDALAAFCWLKVDGPIGEFYAVGVDPARQGEGLGRVLMDAGFARLAERGIREAALYVEADNEPALKLYERYGFTRHTIDVRYRRGTVAV